MILRNDGICDAILNQDKTAPERTAVFQINITTGVVESSKVAVPIDSGNRVGADTLKTGKNW